MNSQLNLIIRRKFFHGEELNKQEKIYVQSLLPVKSEGRNVDMYLYSEISRKMYFIHVFETKADLLKFKEEVRDSLQLKDLLCRYDEKYQNNLALFRTRGLKLRRMRKIIETEVLNQPICTGIFDSKQHILRSVEHGVGKVCTFAIKLHWEPESKIPLLLDDRIVYLPEQREEVVKKDEVKKIPWEEYKKQCKVEQKAKVIIIDCKAEFIKID